MLKAGLLLMTMAMICGCGSLLKKNVAIFDRGILAKPCMQLIYNPMEETGKQHMLNAREGSVGGFGGAGGGCGCN